VLDIHLNGGMGGFDLQAQLAADRVLIPIIFITAHDDVPTRERAENSGAAAYLCKPFNDDLLLDAIRGVVGGDNTRPDQGPIAKSNGNR
jgi:FixJ family two-component response regulator